MPRFLWCGDCMNRHEGWFCSDCDGTAATGFEPEVPPLDFDDNAVRIRPELLP